GEDLLGFAAADPREGRAVERVGPAGLTGPHSGATSPAPACTGAGRCRLMVGGLNQNGGPAPARRAARPESGPAPHAPSAADRDRLKTGRLRGVCRGPTSRRQTERCPHG